jgi:hypothetical protein
MKAYLFRPNEMGEKSCNGIAKYSKTGISVVQSGVDQHPSEPHLCIRWGCISKVPSGRNVLNKLSSMQMTTDKGGFRRLLQEKSLCPPSWGIGWGAEPIYPCVVRPSHHAKSQNFVIANSWSEMFQAMSRFDTPYCSQLIEKEAEYRINILQGRVLCVIEKSAKDEKDVTFSQGTTSILYWSEWPIVGVRLAIAAVQLSGLDFAGVDVIKSKDGNYYVLEVNTCPLLEGSYQQQCFAKGFDWVVKNGRDRIPTEHITIEDWKKYVHPCMSEMARV